MKNLALSTVLLLCCCCKTDIESMAKNQVEKTMKEFARNPESIVVSNMEIVFKTDSACVMHLVLRGKNGFGGYSRDAIEYMYCVQSSGDVYECVVDLKEEGSKYEKFKEQGEKIAPEASPDVLINWIKGNIGLYSMFHGRKIRK